jgi:TonB family protein
MKSASIILTSLALAAAAQAGTASPPVPVVPLHSLIVADDYPVEALRNKEQGSVRFRLQVSSDGRVTQCSILQSSGSPSLDQTSCQILVRRARFTPAKDEAGRAVAGSVENNIRWSLGEETPAMPRLNAATSVWISCVIGEAAKLSITGLSSDLVAERAYAGCALVEQWLASEMKLTGAPGFIPATAIESLKKQYRPQITARVEESRKLFESPDPPGDAK